MQSCDTCKFAFPVSDIAVACRRYPPTITKVDGETVTSHSPLLSRSYWCGEYKVNGNVVHVQGVAIPE